VGGVSIGLLVGRISLDGKKLRLVEEDDSAPPAPHEGVLNPFTGGIACVPLDILLLYTNK